MSDVGLAMVMLEKATLRSARTICESLRKAFPGETIEVTEEDKQKGVYSFDLGGVSLFVSLMPAPVPWSQLETLAAAAWHWKNAAEELRNHRAHLLVTFMNGPADPLDRDLLLTQVTAAILEVQPAIGVLWGGPAISSRALFLEAGKGASRATSLPVLCWMTFNLVKEGGGKYAIVTQGLEQYGHREMELLGDQSSSDAVQMAINLSAYVLKKGPVLKPGQTFGASATEQYPIREGPWRFDPSKRALHLNMRKEPEKKGGLFGRMFGK